MGLEFVIMLNWNVLAIIDTDKSKMSNLKFSLRLPEVEINKSFIHVSLRKRLPKSFKSDTYSRSCTSRAFSTEDSPRVLHLNRVCRASAMTRKLLKDVAEDFIKIFVRLFAQNYSELVNTRLFQRCVVKIF